MALNPARLSRAISPASSEGSIHRGHVSRMRDQDENLKKDKSFRRYAAGVERALGLFDTTLQEWADYISFLSRLLKALQAHPENVRAIPHKALVSKRLAQCLNPGLPSGVHQKALEVYGFIFTLLDDESLGEDLIVYFPGLAPTLGFASLSVRPVFLSLIQERVYKVSTKHLRPALKAIILALLPGLEEETSEDFERTLLLLNGFRKRFASGDSTQSEYDAAGAAYFWQCLFLTSITSPSRRLGVLAYLTRYLPRLGSTAKEANHGSDGNGSASVIAVTSPGPGLLLRCFATGLADEQLLVQRAFLDLLVTHVPLHAEELKSKSVHEDLVLLVTSALGVVLRRDMSLNRRLWSWFLGPEPTSPVRSPDTTDFRSDMNKAIGPQKGYFGRHGRDLTIESLMSMASQISSSPPVRARPFRIALSLMDRWEIGGYVVPKLFIPLMRNVKEFESLANSKEDFDEVFRSANVFFDGVESALIWAKIFHLLIPNGGIEANDDKVADAELAHFIVGRFNIHEEEMLNTHIPLMNLVVVTILNTYDGKLESARGEEDPRHIKYRDELLQILQLLLEEVPSSILVPPQKDDARNGSSAKTPNRDAVLQRIERFYDQCQEAFDLPASPFDVTALSDLTVELTCDLVSRAIRGNQAGRYLQRRVHVLCILLQKCPFNNSFSKAELGDTILQRLSPTTSEGSNGTEHHGKLPFSLLSSLTSLTIFLHTASSNSPYVELSQLKSIIPNIMKNLWAYLSPLTPHVHVEVTACIWQLHTATLPYTLVESALTTLMTRTSKQGDGFLPTKDAIQRFSVIWSQSILRSGLASKTPAGSKEPEESLLDRPMNLVIDVLAQPKSESHQVAREWFQAQTSVDRVLNPIVLRLLEIIGPALGAKFDEGDASLCEWHLERLSHLLSAQSEEQWSKFAQTIPREAIQAGESKETLQVLVAKICLNIIQANSPGSDGVALELRCLQPTAIDILSTLLNSTTSSLLSPLDIDMFLIARLSAGLDNEDNDDQSRLIDCLSYSVRLRVAETRVLQPIQHSRRASKNMSVENLHRMSISERRPSKDKSMNTSVSSPPPKELLDCLLKGVLTVKNPQVLHKWIGLLCDSLPLWSDGIFQVILEIVEHFIRRIQTEFASIQQAFASEDPANTFCSDAPLLHLLNGLEFCIANAHDRLTQDEQYVSGARSPELAQGFFQNMVSNAAGVETNQLRNAIANNRLTIVLCFQDITKTVFGIWSWDRSRADHEYYDDTAASFKHTTLKFRNRCRKILEHLVAAEPLETLEIMIEVWITAKDRGEDTRAASVLNLFHTLEGTRPRNAMPAIFNASYSRTNPNALDPTRKSSLTSSLSDIDLLAFLIVYARSLEDDVLEEIWKDCTTFLRDILGNPMPHRQILPRLLEFVAVLSAKMENTNFGEEWKMRRELGDLFTRLLTAIFTIRPGLAQDSSAESEDVVQILDQTFPALIALLGESDRLTGVISTVSSNIINAAFKTRAFPQNFYPNILSLLLRISKVPGAAKVWRRDVLDAFNDARIFSSSPEMLSRGWQPVLRQLVLSDKDRMTDLLSRLSAPTTAGIMFGVGASAARLDADKKAQLNLRRIVLILLCVEPDTFAGQYPQLLAKIEELLTATPITSPSSTTRAEIYLVLRAIVLKSSSIHLAQFWPVISSELYNVFTELISELTASETPDSTSAMTYSPYSTLQAAKLLDTLLLIRPDDFQLQEWLFVTDTMDAIYPPHHQNATTTPSISSSSLPLADDVSLAFQAIPPPSPNPHSPAVTPSATSQTNPFNTTTTTTLSHQHSKLQPPFLASSQTRSTQIFSSAQFTTTVLLRPFFSNLSIHAMESTYSLNSPDIDAALADLVEDLVVGIPEQ